MAKKRRSSQDRQDRAASLPGGQRGPSPIQAGAGQDPVLEWRVHPGAAAVAFLAVAVSGFLFHTKMPADKLWNLWAGWREVIPPLFSGTGAFWLAGLKGALRLGLMHLCAWGLGAWVVKALGTDAGEAGGLERALIRSALGWGTLGILMLCLGLAGLWRLWALGGVLGLGFVGAARELGLPGRPAEPEASAGPTARGASPSPARQPWTPWEGLLVLVLVVLACFNFFAAMMPEIFYDALVYHLALPDIYWRRGGVVPVPENMYSGLPLMVQMLYGAALPIGGDGLCRLLSTSFGWETALAAFALGRRFGGRSAGLLAAALFYTIPYTGAMSWKASVEHGQAVFHAASLLALAAMLSGGARPRRWAVCAGLLTGFALGCKYQAWPALPITALALFWIRLKEPAGAAGAADAGSGAGPGRTGAEAQTGVAGPRAAAAAWEAAVFALAAGLLLVPWCAKNLAHYGNPIYPVLQERFASGAPGSRPVPRWSEMMQDAEKVSPSAVFASGSELLRWLEHPWRIPWENMDHGPILFLAIPFVLLCRFRPPGLRLVWLVWIGLWLSWALTSRMFRYVLPAVPAAAVLAALGFDLGFKGAARAALRLGLSYVLVFNLVYTMTWFAALGAAGVVLGREDAAAYLKVPHPSYHNPVYAAIEFVNDKLPPDAKVLFLGEGRRYGCRREAVVMTYYDQYPLQWWIEQSAGLADLRRRFADAGITHILVNRLELGRWQAPDRKYLRLPEGKRTLWMEFMTRSAARVFESRSPGPDNQPWAETAVYRLTL